MTTKKRAGKAAKTKKGGIPGGGGGPEPSGSPIIVDGGGSVTIDFDSAAYLKTGNKHKNNNPAVFVRDIELTGSVNQSIQIDGQPVKITVNLVSL